VYKQYLLYAAPYIRSVLLTGNEIHKLKLIIQYYFIEKITLTKLFPLLSHHKSPTFSKTVKIANLKCIILHQ